MNPILYSSTETLFTRNGVGILSDAISCTVTEERNGAFELEMQYPTNGIHYSDILLRAIISAKPNPDDDAQPFRVYRITRPINGIVTVYAQHISYDLSGIPDAPFSASNVSEALSKLKSSASVNCPFDFWTDKATVASMQSPVPASIRSLLGGSEGSILDNYGGEYKWDKFIVKLYGSRGANRGVSIRYGKNLTSIEQDENCASVYTGVYPYYKASDGALVQLPEKTINAAGTYSFTRIMPLDLSSDFTDGQPTVAQLREKAQSYMASNNIGVPTVSLTVSFENLSGERVSLCDTVNVEFPDLGVSATAKCVKTTYNVLLDRYTSVDIGDAKTNISDTIMGQQKEIEKAPSTTFMQNAIDNATLKITGNTGGYVVMHSSTGSDEPDEILIMDTPSIDTAVKVWRWNSAGLGYSGTGYNGPYGLAMTNDGHIVADYIAAGTLDASKISVTNLIANSITSGILSSANGNTFFDLNNNQIVVKDNSGNKIVLSASEIDFYDANGSIRSKMQTDILSVGCKAALAYADTSKLIVRKDPQNAEVTSRAFEIMCNNANTAYLILNDNTMHRLFWEYDSANDKYYLCGGNENPVFP